MMCSGFSTTWIGVVSLPSEDGGGFATRITPRFVILSETKDLSRIVHSFFLP